MAVVEDEKELSSLMIVKKDVTDENRDSKPNEPIEPLKFNEESQQSVTLSSTEAEWIALSEAVKDILFFEVLMREYAYQSPNSNHSTCEQFGSCAYVYKCNDIYSHKTRRYKKKICKGICSGWNNKDHFRAI